MGPLRTAGRSENSDALLPTPAFSAFLPSLFLFLDHIFVSISETIAFPQILFLDTNINTEFFFKFRTSMSVPLPTFCISRQKYEISLVLLGKRLESTFFCEFKSDGLPFVSSFPIFPTDFGRVLKFKNVKYERMSQLIADYPIRRTAALERDVLKSERKVTRRRGMRRKEQREERTRRRSRGRDLAGTGMNAERSSVGSHATSTAPNLETRRSRERNFTSRVFTISSRFLSLSPT